MNPRTERHLIPVTLVALAVNVVFLVWTGVTWSGIQADRTAPIAPPPDASLSARAGSVGSTQEPAAARCLALQTNLLELDASSTGHVLGLAQIRATLADAGCPADTMVPHLDRKGQGEPPPSPTP